MRNPLERRIARLEALQPPKSDRIPIFVWNEDDVPKKIEEMIAAGEIAEADRHRCAWWLDIKHRTEWQRQWENEKLLAEDAARQKAKEDAEKADRENAECQKSEQTSAGPDEPEQAETEAAESQHAEQSQAESPPSRPEPAKREQTHVQAAEPQDSDLPQAQQATADDGTVPPGCL